VDEGGIAQSLWRPATSWTTPRIGSQWGKDIRHLSRPVLVSIQPPLQWIPRPLVPSSRNSRAITLHPLNACTETQCLYKGVPGVSRGYRAAGGYADPSHLLVPWSRKNRTIPLHSLRPVEGLSACTRMQFILPLFYNAWIRNNKIICISFV
jgi:hypothetical protein